MRCDDRSEERDRCVTRQLARRDISDERVLDAMRRVERHRFVPDALSAAAYDDRPLPIGYDATISQPYIVALMAQALSLGPTDRVLEIGTGSGYAAAVLAELGASVVTVECVEALTELARARLRPYGDRVAVICGDGSLGYPPDAPYDAISVAAAARSIPPPLLEQLAAGGRLVAPVGSGTEDLVLVTRTPAGDVHETLTQVRFVPLQGRHGA
jgi:protein-L-isoaspartate(D-aspartate) O-methyltransferase